jgi:hypothetical protein
VAGVVRRDGSRASSSPCNSATDTDSTSATRCSTDIRSIARTPRSIWETQLSERPIRAANSTWDKPKRRLWQAIRSPTWYGSLTGDVLNRCPAAGPQRRWGDRQLAVGRGEEVDLLGLQMKDASERMDQALWGQD